MFSHVASKYPNKLRNVGEFIRTDLPYLIKMNFSRIRNLKIVLATFDLVRLGRPIVPCEGPLSRVSKAKKMDF